MLFRGFFFHQLLPLSAVRAQDTIEMLYKADQLRIASKWAHDRERKPLVTRVCLKADPLSLVILTCVQHYMSGSASGAPNPAPVIPPSTGDAAEDTNLSTAASAEAARDPGELTPCNENDFELGACDAAQPRILPEKRGYAGYDTNAHGPEVAPTPCKVKQMSLRPHTVQLQKADPLRTRRACRLVTPLKQQLFLLVRILISCSASLQRVRVMAAYSMRKRENVIRTVLADPLKKGSSRRQPHPLTPKRHWVDFTADSKCRRRKRIRR